VHGSRFLIVTADDFGIGPGTSEGILDLAAQGAVTSTVLLVTSPFAEQAVRAWRRKGASLDLGWHPCLTLDRPVLQAEKVPTLVDEAGNFFPLGGFLRRLWLGRIRAEEIESELRAQYRRFCEIVGRTPLVVNTHHHVQVFRPIGAILQSILAEQAPLPYLRRVHEPLRTLALIPGGRIKRAFLSACGRRQPLGGVPGNDWLAGITDPQWVTDSRFFARWLRRIPGCVVELTCHPGYLDRTLIGRDCKAGDSQLLRRGREFHLLSQPGFASAAQEAGFRLISAAEFITRGSGGRAHAA
jgi:chitin disaccharide deacetylase